MGAINNASTAASHRRYLVASVSSRGDIIICDILKKNTVTGRPGTLNSSTTPRRIDIKSGMSSQPFGWACGADYFTNKYAKRRRAQRIVRRRIFPPPPRVCGVLLYLHCIISYPYIYTYVCVCVCVVALQ